MEFPLDKFLKIMGYILNILFGGNTIDEAIELASTRFDYPECQIRDMLKNRY